MAWLETCRIDTGKQVRHLSKQGMSTRQAIKKLSAESGIPENTINNWIYERTVSKQIDMFHFFLPVMRNDFIVDGLSADKAQRFFSDGKIMILWGMLWLLLEKKYIHDWYLSAFEKHGKTAKITNMLRIGKIWCNCPNFDCKVKQKDKPHASMNPALFSQKGYVNFNAIQKEGV